MRSPEQVAAGFLAIAVENMANAIKKISLQRGYDVSEYTLCCFGGAGGQHACQIADTLGIKQVFIHPKAGVLSAYGMGLADVRVMQSRAIEAQLTPQLIPQLHHLLSQLETEAKQKINPKSPVTIIRKVHLKYQGTDSPIIIDFSANLTQMQGLFESAHQQRYGFIMPEKSLIVEAVSTEVVEKMPIPEEQGSKGDAQTAPPPSKGGLGGILISQSVFHRDDLQPGDCISGPAIIIDSTGTNVVETGWQAELTESNCLILKRVGTEVKPPVGAPLMTEKAPDPVMLEIFNNLLRAIAEQMGITLQNTATSVNIKERLDFSCAIFDQNGQLVANAPHIPVHLGSMSESVQALINAKGNTLQPGDVYISNNPYNGGTHLPDITAITPVFEGQNILFYVASRGHHADIGGITPGSMPPHSSTIEQEGILLDNFHLVSGGKFQESELLKHLNSGSYPARNPQQNIADLQAQIAANESGVQELRKMVKHFGLATTQAYMQHVQNNAEASVRRVIEVLQDGEFTYKTDNGAQIKVKITIDQSSRSACIDFTGTSEQQTTNFNAPAAVCKAAVLYVFRTLVDDNIPLNAGCLKPLEIIIPEGCMLNPRYPAAVVAGNVETSQVIVDALYGALGVMAASQGTMNNFTFGNQKHQYYETICGGSGAGPGFHGTDAVHTHMTNSRLTDPEVLEWRFPVILESFAIRPDSGGKGVTNGGNGVIRRLRFLETMTAGILSSHRVIPPFGLCGGGDGVVGKNYVVRQDGNVEELGSTGTVEMSPGDTFVIETPGGGGYGIIGD